MYQELINKITISEVEEIFNTSSLEVFFNENEIHLVEKKNAIKSLGARYIAKKLILDYLNIDKGYKDIEIDNDETGKPTVLFSGKVEENLNKQNVSSITVSLSHSRNYVASLVVIEKNV